MWILKRFYILIMSSILSFDIINIVVLCKAEGEECWWPDPKIFLCIPASAAAVNSKGIKTILANGLITFFIKGNSVFSNGPSNLPRNPPYCIVLDNWVFDNLISVNELFAKALRIFTTCLLVSNNSWGKIVSLSPIIFDDNLKLIQFHFLLQILTY